MSIYILAKKAKMRENTRAYNESIFIIKNQYR